MSWEIPDVQARFRKGSGTRDQVANIGWIIKKVREFQKNIYFCFINYAKSFDCVDQNKLWKILKDMGIPDHWLASWELCMQVRKQQLKLERNNRLVPNRERSTSRLYMSPCLFNLYAEYIIYWWTFGSFPNLTIVNNAAINIGMPKEAGQFY